MDQDSGLSFSKRGSPPSPDDQPPQNTPMSKLSSLLKDNSSATPNPASLETHTPDQVSPTASTDAIDPPQGHQRDNWVSDEIVPDLDYGRVINDWNSPQAAPRGRSRVTSGKIPIMSPTSDGGSYLDLNNLHSSVKPQPINSPNFSRYSYSKLHEVMKMRIPSGASATGSPGGIDIKPRRKSIADSQDVNYEAILHSLPSNFNELPYSQRKKLVTSFSESVDYSQFSLFAKNYLNDQAGSLASSLRGGSSGSSSSLRRSRTGSINTIAGRLLQQSTTDLKKMQSQPEEKYDVDERGAIVMGYELGKVIGYGAWGTIRECIDRNHDNKIRAIKIVSSQRSDSHNPKVLEVFRKEIKIWKELHHPNILPLLQSKETESTIFCITNRIWGGTLFDMVNNWGEFDRGCRSTMGHVSYTVDGQRSRIVKTIDYLRQIVDGLAYMHNKGIVHGDLKLENILVEGEEGSTIKMILCDFGMSRKFAHSGRRPSMKLRQMMGGDGSDDDDDDDDGSLFIRSRSTQPRHRKPLLDPISIDDCAIGTLHGPALQSVGIGVGKENACKPSFEKTSNGTEPLHDVDLPHTHIGSLPYAAPELLSDSPPPLGPSADIWALGVMAYDLLVGRLPFMHQNENKLREIITAGNYDTTSLRQACLLEPVMTADEHDLFRSPSMGDVSRHQLKHKIEASWNEYHHDNGDEFRGVADTIAGCLDPDITKRWDLDNIHDRI